MSAERHEARASQGVAAEGRRRIFQDATGRTWEVYEAPQPAFDRRGGTCLVFACEEAIRRVRVFPSHWYELSEQELHELSWNR